MMKKTKIYTVAACFFLCLQGGGELLKALQQLNPSITQEHTGRAQEIINRVASWETNDKHFRHLVFCLGQPAFFSASSDVQVREAKMQECLQKLLFENIITLQSFAQQPASSSSSSTQTPSNPPSRRSSIASQPDEDRPDESKEESGEMRLRGTCVSQVFGQHPSSASSSSDASTLPQQPLPSPAASENGKLIQEPDEEAPLQTEESEATKLSNAKLVEAMNTTMRAQARVVETCDQRDGQYAAIIEKLEEQLADAQKTLKRRTSNARVAYFEREDEAKSERIAQLEAEIARLQGEIEQSKQDAATWREEKIKQYNAELETLSLELQEKYNQKMEEIRRQEEPIKEQLIQMGTTIAELHSDKQTLTRENASLKQSNASITSLLADKSHKVIELEVENTNLKQSVLGKHEELVAKNGEIQQLTASNAEKDAQITALTQAGEVQGNRIEELAAEVTAKEARIQELCTQNAQREERIGALAQSVADKEVQIASTSADLATRDAEVARLNEAITSINADLAAGANDITRLTEELREAKNAKDVEIATLTQGKDLEVAQLKQALEAATTERDEIKAAKDNLDDIISKQAPKEVGTFWKCINWGFTILLSPFLPFYFLFKLLTGF